VTLYDPTDAPIRPEEVEAWRGHIGRREIRRQRLDIESLRRFAAAQGADMDVVAQAPPLGHWAYFVDTVGPEVWTPGATDLFRFSAVTFNSHRIHYDLAYATGEEGYPGLVVHGPFTAATLFALAQARGGRPIRRFAFRAMAPLFAGQPIQLAPGAEAGEVQAIRCDGAVAMSATAGFDD